MKKEDRLNSVDKLLFALTDYPQSRCNLSIKLGVSDRTLRKTVEVARLQGVPICSNSRTDGYWLGSGADIQHTIAEYETRGLRALEVARRLKRCQLDGQVEL